jgi:hypothetical protein
MLSRLVAGGLLLASCVTIHALGLMAAFRWMQRRMIAHDGRLWPSTWMLIRVAGWTVLLHVLQIAVWALSYTWAKALPDLELAFYFSAVTYTTTGYGDIVLRPEWRLFGSTEALTGILMCGLSTGFFFAIFDKVFGLSSSESSGDPPAPKHGQNLE